MPQVHGPQKGDFLVGVGGYGHAVHKPGGAKGGIVHQRRIRAVQHHVSGVQGVEDRCVGSHPGLHLLQLADLVQLLVQAVDFAGQVVLDEVLVAL